MSAPNTWKCIIAATTRAGLSLSAGTNEMRKDQRNVSHLPHTHCSSLADAPCSPALCSKTSTYRIGRRRDATEHIAAAKKKSKKRFLPLTETDEREAHRESHIMKNERKKKTEQEQNRFEWRPIRRCETWLSIVHQLLLFVLCEIYFILFSFRFMFFRYFRSTWRCAVSADRLLIDFVWPPLPPLPLYNIPYALWTHVSLVLLSCFREYPKHVMRRDCAARMVADDHIGGLSRANCAHSFLCCVITISSIADFMAMRWPGTCTANAQKLSTNGGPVAVVDSLAARWTVTL